MVQKTYYQIQRTNFAFNNNKKRLGKSKEKQQKIDIVYMLENVRFTNVR